MLRFKLYNGTGVELSVCSDAFDNVLKIMWDSLIIFFYIIYRILNSFDDPIVHSVWVQSVSCVGG